jgi:sulfate/thiosulfate-binding protein
MLTCTVGITIVARMQTRPRHLVALALALIVALLLGACGSDDKSDDAGSGGAATTTKLSLVSFSVPKAAHDAAQAAFGKTDVGKGVKWTNSYGASGDQSRAVVSGLKADVVHFSLESDVTRLVDANLVDPSWNAGEHKGIISSSVVVIAVRKGNPKHITGWDDLVKDGIGIVTPNPGSSGSARWNILAAWGHVTSTGGSEADATAYLTKFFQNTVALPGSGRDATTAFTGGTGDVLISYENEAILARQSGADFDYIVPDQSLLIENPGAVTVGANAKAKDYLDYVVSKAGQTEFAKVGFRPIVDGITTNVKGANDPSDPFPTVKQLLTITKDFGGWSAAAKKFFDPDTGLVTKIQQTTGKS